MSAEIEAFIRAFEDCTLPAAEWTHDRHLVMALWYLRRFPSDEATRRIRDGIRRYNLSRGNPNGYHETITLAWAAVITDFLAGCPADRPLEELSDELLASRGDRDYLLRFYSWERLFSDEARSRWVPPDLRPLDPGPRPQSPAD